MADRDTDRGNGNASARLGLRVVARQTWHDLFGTKDVQDSPTLSYVWTADQFGHFGLGSLGTLLAGRILEFVTPGRDVFSVPARVLPYLAGGLIFAIWMAYKEWTDYRDERAKASGAFAFNRVELVWNCVTAWFYTVAGSAVLVAFIWQLLAGLVCFAGLLALGGGIAFWWLRRKIAFQQADLPYLYRLANFPDNFADPGDVAIIENLCRRKRPQFRHVILVGPLGSGKTSLAVGLTTEFAFRLGIARLTSLIKLLQTQAAAKGIGSRAGLHRGTIFQDGRTLWPFETIELLVVDDLDVAANDAVLLAPDLVRPALTDEPGTRFMSSLATRRTVWIAGDPARAAAWEELLANLIAGDDKSSFKIVPLKSSLVPPPKVGAAPGPITAGASASS